MFVSLESWYYNYATMRKPGLYTRNTSPLIKILELCMHEIPYNKLLLYKILVKFDPIFSCQVTYGIYINS